MINHDEITGKKACIIKEKDLGMLDRENKQKMGTQMHYGQQERTNLISRIYIYMYIYVCVYICISINAKHIDCTVFTY